ncbi:MAG: nucleotidyl transferase AbiEii/AbiGii toxin family protein [Ignavibacteriales bacterium]|nr:nucleotidyl transferase AbiEii/AbiGii toxin family protein [Ignavibacteriales bacterium]
MIERDEIRRAAGRIGVDPLVIEHDYILGCCAGFLAADERTKRSWVFKGGTSLAKCYFHEYRFSEDLDFTATKEWAKSEVGMIADTARARMQDDLGIRTDLQSIVVDEIEDDYGKESFEVKIYYLGPWRQAGSPRSIRIHLNRDETMVFQTREKEIYHPYSDGSLLPAREIHCYALEEVFVEKLRAISAQRKYAIARDIFDLHFLSTQNLDQKASIGALGLKCRIKGIDAGTMDLERFFGRKEEYRADWADSLEHLLPHALRIPFEEAWGTVATMLQEVSRLYQSSA